MPQDQQISLETPEFSVRTGAPTGKQTIVKKPLEISDVTTQKGKWLRDKLSSLYTDPKYKTASSEQQKAYKDLAYTKWVQPYFTKVLKTSAPTKEDWLTGSTHLFEGTSIKDRPIEGAYKKAGAEIGLHTMKTTTDITSGLLHDLSYIGRVMDSLVGDDERKPGEKNLEQVFEAGSQAVKKKGEAWQGRLDDLHSVHKEGEKPKFTQDVPGRLAELGTGAVFFEATGAGKAVKVLNVANPKTVSLAFQMAKASWNGAVDYGLWSASQGDKPKEVVESFGTGGVLGPAAKLAPHVTAEGHHLEILYDLFKDLFKWGGKDATQQVVNEAITKASTKIEATSSSETSALSEQSRKASTIAATSLEKYSKEKFNKSFKDLAYIQRQHVLNKLLALSSDAISTAKEEGMPKQLIQAQAKEQDELMAQIFPEARASQQKIEEFVKQSGLEPQSTKLLATLPHHNTTIDSSWKHLQARASFLKSQLRTAKGSEKEGIQQALNEEYALMKEKSAKQKAKGTVGGAAAGDPRAFHGEEFTITPNVDPYRHGFTEWYSDTFAKGVAKEAKVRALAQGQKQSFIANAIDNSFFMGSNISAAIRRNEGITKQLYHEQFGLVGGINYEVRQNELYINHLAMRPNVVARVWPVKGGGQTLFLHAAQEAARRDLGIRLIPFDESKSFYEKLGLFEDPSDRSHMILGKEGVKNLLKNKGLLMMLLGAGITYGASKELSQGDYSVGRK